ncbi:HNH endonuclease [Sulfurimonas sp. CS5]|uniref:HNH endonuclease n=1 Tax=Sulfurimonas sp. CS5 TaxID=3391145 RepID=UPI0039EAAFC4
MKESMHQSDIDEIKTIFNEFINSLDSSVQDEARDFFYTIDIRNTFTTLSTFKNTTRVFEDDQEKKLYELKAKKFYFAYIMNLGGQASYKKAIKEKVDKEQYSFEDCEVFLAELITNKELELYAESIPKRKKEIIKEIKKINDVMPDYHASYRNERQLFFYYGFFHGKYSADLSGFYKLTNIGNSVLQSNFHELILIWEHQKLKMISQSPVNDIQNLERQDTLNYDSFGILSHPYNKLLEIINNKESISLDEYQHIISKIKNSSESYSELFNESIDSYITKAESFDRSGDLGSADFRKELIKYILGVCELPKDQDTNYFKFISWFDNMEIRILDKDKSNFISMNYNFLTQYLDEKNQEFYSKCETELKNKYLATVNETLYEEDEKVIYSWNKYIINFDENIYLNLIYIGMSLRLEKYDYSIRSNEIRSLSSDYKTIYKMFGFTKTEFVTFIKEIQRKLSSGITHTLITEDESEYEETIPSELATEALLNKLQDISSENTVSNNIHISIGRERSSTLISNLKAYYINEYANSSSKLIKCDCCQDTTFVTRNGIAYLEFHHLIPFNQELGPDHYMNLFGICPACHRKLHFIENNKKEDLYTSLSQNNNLNKPIIERIKILMDENAIEPIHLDFLKSEFIITHDEYNDLMNEGYMVA